MNRLAVCLCLLAACGDDSVATVPPDALDCTSTPGEPENLGRVTDALTLEISGIASSRAHADLLWAHGDSGNLPYVYAIDTRTAKVAATLMLGGTATDWEDAAAAPCGDASCLFIADTGDNDMNRASVGIVQIQEPTTTPDGDIPTDAQRYDVTYPDGKHDVEALFIDPRDGAAYVITKETPTQKVFRMPLSAGVMTVAEPVGTLSLGGLVTSADFSVTDCGARLLVRTLDALVELDATSSDTIETVLAATPRAMPAADEPQGEAVAWRSDGGAYYTLSEGDRPPLWRVRR